MKTVYVLSPQEVGHALAEHVMRKNNLLGSYNCELRYRIEKGDISVEVTFTEPEKKDSSPTS